MSDFPAIVEHWSRRRGEPLALATVVRTQGSTYRRPGARMLVDASGATFGLVSGGCLESDVAGHALRTLRTGRPELLHYDTRRLLGCNGALEILVESIGADESERFLTVAESCLRRRQILLGATVFKAPENSPPPIGSIPVLSAGGEVFESRRIPEELLSRSRAALSAAGPRPDWYRSANGEAEALLHAIQPPVQLFVFGGGPDIVPVCSFAQQLGWRVTAIVHPSQQPPELSARSDVRFATPDEIPALVAPDPRTAAIVMTHHYGRDLAVLAHLLPMPLPYIGLLGPRNRRTRLLAELADLAGALDPSALHSPAGLDIAAEGPAEIALSILSEIKAVLAGHAGSSLRERKAGIHALPACVRAA